MSGAYIQIRTNEQDKQEASKILAELGTNLSAVLNMTIKQIILQRRIPFEISLPTDLAVSGVAASMAMEGMPLDAQEQSNLNSFHQMSRLEQEQQIAEIVQHYKNREKTHV